MITYNEIYNMLLKAYSDKFIPTINYLNSTSDPIYPLDERITENYTLPISYEKYIDKYFTHTNIIVGIFVFSILYYIGLILLYMYHPLITFAILLYIFAVIPVTSVFMSIIFQSSPLPNINLNIRDQIMVHQKIIDEIFENSKLSKNHLIFVFNEMDIDVFVKDYIDYKETFGDGIAIKWIKYEVYRCKLGYFKKFNIPICPSSIKHLEKLKANFSGIDYH